MNGVKDVKGKPRLDLIPYGTLVSMAEVREFGNNKYNDPGKWYTDKEMSVPEDIERVIQFVAAAMRHSFKYTDSVYYHNRSPIDEESGIHHLKHALCSLGMAVSLLEKESTEGRDVK